MRKRNLGLMVLLFAVAAIKVSAVADSGTAKKAAQQALQKAQQTTIERSINKHNKQGEEAAQRVFEKYQGEEFQQKLAAELRRLKDEVFTGVSVYAESQQAILTGKDSALALDEAVYVFISSSIPLMTLRGYAHDIALLGEINIKLVMRGFIGDMSKMHPTLTFIMEFLKEDTACDVSEVQCDRYMVEVIIEPRLFRLYGVESVPAIMYVHGAIPGSQTPGLSYVAYGDASIRYALEEINRRAHRPALDTIVKKLNG